MLFQIFCRFPVYLHGLLKLVPPLFPAFQKPQFFQPVHTLQQYLFCQNRVKYQNGHKTHAKNIQ